MAREMSPAEIREFKEWAKAIVEDMVENDPGNRSAIDGTPFFDRPLVGFVGGDDEIFTRFKKVIGEFHLTPREVLVEAARRRGLRPPEGEGIGVISYILPISERTKRENAGMTDAPSKRWSHTRLHGEQFSKKLAATLARTLTEEGYFAIAPELEEVFRLVKDSRVGEASNWSQRHIAYAAGLGTFGLSDGLITPAGKAHRAGSVIVTFPLDSPPRPDRHHYCLYFRKGSCRACAERCPVGAITEEGHDKEKCAAFVYGQRDRVNREYGIDIYGCGLCQTGVPCESAIPRGLRD